MGQVSKKLTESQIVATAISLNVPVAALRAVMSVECKQDGFLSTGEPVILFERHVFYERLRSKPVLRARANADRPDICNPVAGGYGLTTAQHSRLQVACRYDRTAALESASWGVGQVMGYQWAALGYPSLQSFITAMYRDEYSQFDAMCRFIRVNGLVDELQRQDWAGFARRYNGPRYRQNLYDHKLAQAYLAFGGK